MVLINQPRRNYVTSRTKFDDRVPSFIFLSRLEQQAFRSACVTHRDYMIASCR